MGDQNIFDNQAFFDGYKKLRDHPGSANDMVEKPALFSLCPDFTGKTVLDLGCGYGENCRVFSELGARKVVGIDISEKMLRLANEENHLDNVRFLHMSMSDIKLREKFDVVASSLAVHYIQDFDRLLTSVYGLLNDNGFFIFSQEHPFTTATVLKKGDYWSRDSDGEILHYNLTGYGIPGERSTNWIVDGLIKYHRSISELCNALIAHGFAIEKVLEPLPDEAVMAQYPAYRRYYHKPDFLLVKSRRR